MPALTTVRYATTEARGLGVAALFVALTTTYPSKADDLFESSKTCRLAVDADQIIRGCTSVVDDMKTKNAIKAWPFIRRGQARRRTKDFSGSIADLTDAITLAPEPRVYLERAKSYVESGECSDLAKRDLDLMAEQAGGNTNQISMRAEAHSLRAICANRAGDTDKAIKENSLALSDNPRQFAASVNQGIIYLKLGKLHEAKEVLSSLLGLNPRLSANQISLANYWLGKTSLAQGDRKTAIKFFTKAIEMDPNLRDAYAERMNIYIDTGEADLAEKDREALETFK